MSDQPVLRVEDLQLGFAGEHGVLPVVDGLDFEVARGRTLCLVGESGCGKSVTALAVMGLLPVPPAVVGGGRVLFEGRDLLTLGQDALSDLRGHRLAMVFQEPMTSLNPVFTVGQQIEEIVRRHRSLSREEATREALAVLERVRIPEPARRLGQYPHELSGGMRQRVMIAMALVNAPSLLIADEPTTALDVTIQAQILELVRGLQRDSGTAVLLITHDLGVVAEMADEVAVMYAGRIVEHASVEALFRDTQHPYTLGLMSSIPRLDRKERRLAAIPGTVPPPQAWPKGCRFSTRCPFVIDKCRREPPPLAELAPGHKVACWRAPVELDVPAEEAA